MSESVADFVGMRSPWSGAEIWINPEADQGLGLSNSFGVAGYFSGEAYKLGQADPYYRMARGVSGGSRRSNQTTPRFVGRSPR